MKYGYVRISSAESDDFLEQQMEALRDAGCAEHRIFTERRTGVAGHRPAYDALMDAVEGGDQVLVWSLDRIGRSLDHLTVLIADLRSRGASLRTLGEDTNIDTSSTSNSEHSAFFRLLSAFKTRIDIERRLHNDLRQNPIRNRSTTLLMNWEQLEQAQNVLRDRLYPVNQLCRELGITPPTLYSYIAPSGDLRERGMRVMEMKQRMQEMLAKEQAAADFALPTAEARPTPKLVRQLPAAE